MTEEPNQQPEPKIIVDDDWKTQVEKEKEELKKQESSPEDQSEPLGELPEASFMVLLSTLGSQAMASMGLFPDPMTGQPTVNLPMAKHFIDTLTMLQEKTKGNLTEEEAAHLRDALHQLRMLFVSASTQPTQPTPPNEPPPTSSIELP